MDPNDLLRMLDLDGRPARPPDGGTPPLTPSATAPAPAASGSPTALEVDEWGLRRGRDLVAESDRLRGSGADAYAAADFFTAAFDPDPRLAGGCADPLRHRFLTQLLDTPEYRALHADTRLDDTAAGIAAGHLAEQFAKLKEDEKKTDESPGGAPPAGGAGDLAGEVAGLRAVGRAVAGAREEVDGLRDACAAVGLGPGEPGANDPRAIAGVYRRVRDDPTLRRICDLAGRFRRVAAGRQRRKVRHGIDDVVGIEPGGDVGRLLPSELARLALPELELDALRRIAERAGLCREHHAAERVGKGPILCVVDESGSMEGRRAHTAKALALALAWVARRQKRWCGLVAYSGATGERLLALPPGRWDEAALCGWVTAFIGGGSDLDLPIEELPRMYAEVGAPPGTTDVVLITDARARIPAALRDRFVAWKQSVKARVVSLVIDHPPGDLAAVSDEVHAVASLDPDADAVGRVLSL